MMFSWKKFVLFSITLLMLNGCEQNNDFTLLLSYPKKGACSIDGPERGSVVNKEEDLLIRGWAYDEQSQYIPDTLTLYFIHEETQSLTSVAVKRGELRGDVAKTFGNPALEASGFSGKLLKNQLERGNYRLILLQIDRKVGVIACAGEAHKISVN